jgi:hypothetical protein
MGLAQKLFRQSEKIHPLRTGDPQISVLKSEKKGGPVNQSCNRVSSWCLR